MPDGVYQVELGFAEIDGAQRGERVFDVRAHGAEMVSHMDIALESGGRFTALTKTFTVTDGRLDLELSPVTGAPLVNFIRVTQRPGMK